MLYGSSLSTAEEARKWGRWPVGENGARCGVAVDRPGAVVVRADCVQGGTRQEERLRLCQWVRGP
ncbi:MAG: hypothetical protein ACOY81_11755 [Bacillota bacterium]|uniref:hypothetical protein n=1 Tax=Desulfurispora thermophila TaxID=265470 RepID=UPI00039F7B71|nr:hypothetical protein [Desulfurispora thermophila]